MLSLVVKYLFVNKEKNRRQFSPLNPVQFVIYIIYIYLQQVFLIPNVHPSTSEKWSTEILIEKD
jgi:hypothetical protein